MNKTALAAIAALSVLASPAPRETFAFQDHAFIVTGDTFSPGNCAALELDSPWTSSTSLEPVGALPAVRHFLGLHWVVDRSPGGEIQAIDPATFDTVVRFTVGGSRATSSSRVPTERGSRVMTARGCWW